jgi:myo-inositol 2-dehydrogenase/D-chiro-inositol 1-dehydrogenase/scyllo-inositol 2-dehydrogenase (NAD+)
MSLGFGLVGAGAMGEIYAKSLAGEVSGARLVAVTGGRRAAPLAARHGVDHAPDLDALLARSDVDAVALTSPTQLHRAQTVAAAAARKHVFTEKPMAVTLDDCDAMISACRSAGVVLSVNTVTRFRRGIRLAKQLVDEGRIGRIRMVRHTYGFIEGDYTGGKQWIAQPGAGSPFLDQGSHCNDVIRWFVGSDATSAYAHYASYTAGEPADQSAMVTYTFANGVMAQLWASYELPSPGFGPRGWSIEYLFAGSEGIIDVEYYGALRFGRDGQWETLYEHPKVDIAADPLDPNRTYPYTDQLQDFVDAISAGRSPLVTGEDGRAGIEMAIAADRSAASGERVRLPLEVAS